MICHIQFFIFKLHSVPSHTQPCVIHGYSVIIVPSVVALHIFILRLLPRLYSMYLLLPIFPLSCRAALGSTIVLGNSLIAYMDRLVPADILQDPSNAIARAQGLIQELQLHPYPSADKARWKKDSDRLPYLEVAFNDLSFSYSGPDLRASEAGCEEFMTRPEEFVEESDGELITGRAGGSSHADRPNHLNVHVVGANV